jgi:hypothetical protein
MRRSLILDQRAPASETTETDPGSESPGSAMTRDYSMI